MLLLEKKPPTVPGSQVEGHCLGCRFMATLYRGAENPPNLLCPKPRNQSHERSTENMALEACEQVICALPTRVPAGSEPLSRRLCSQRHGMSCTLVPPPHTTFPLTSPASWVRTPASSEPGQWHLPADHHSSPFPCVHSCTPWPAWLGNLIFLYRETTRLLSLRE